MSVGLETSGQVPPTRPRAGMTQVGDRIRAHLIAQDSCGDTTQAQSDRADRLDPTSIVTRRWNGFSTTSNNFAA